MSSSVHQQASVHMIVIVTNIGLFSFGLLFSFDVPGIYCISVSLIATLISYFVLRKRLYDHFYNNIFKAESLKPVEGGL